MSKLCNIAIKENDGSIECINLYAVATVNREGLLLYQYYQDPNKIQSLIDLGDLMDLCSTVRSDPYKMHDVVNRQKDVCVAFGRDAGEIGHNKRVYKGNEDFNNDLKTNFMKNIVNQIIVKHMNLLKMPIMIIKDYTQRQTTLKWKLKI